MLISLLVRSIRRLLKLSMVDTGFQAATLHTSHIARHCDIRSQSEIRFLEFLMVNQKLNGSFG